MNRKRIKLLEKAQADTRQQIAAAAWLKNIQECLVTMEEDQADL